MLSALKKKLLKMLLFNEEFRALVARPAAAYDVTGVCGSSSALARGSGLRMPNEHPL
jgi:hypothetical protein